MRWRLRRHDLLFMIETLMPGRDDREHTADLIILAEKPLAFLANRYLQFAKHTLFEL